MTACSRMSVPPLYDLHLYTFGYRAPTECSLIFELRPGVRYDYIDFDRAPPCPTVPGTLGRVCPGGSTVGACSPRTPASLPRQDRPSGHGHGRRMDFVLDPSSTRRVASFQEVRK